MRELHIVRMTARDIMRIAAEAACDPRTVENVYDGRPSKRLVRERIEAAAKTLNILAPPPAPITKPRQKPEK